MIDLNQELKFINNETKTTISLDISKFLMIDPTTIKMPERDSPFHNNLGKMNNDTFLLRKGEKNK